MNRISKAKQANIAAHLADGNTIRSTSRLLKLDLNTVMRNLRAIGEACASYHDEHVHGLVNTKRIECDEAVTFIGAKENHLKPHQRGNPNFGNLWIWSSYDPDHKFVINWRAGRHQLSDAVIIMDDLARRVPGRVQITTDQLPHYHTAIANAFGNRADFATIKKLMHEPEVGPDLKKAAAKLRGNRVRSEFGNPDPKKITTTGVECMHTRLRTWNRRMTRDAITFSRDLRNTRASLALQFMYANFCRNPPSIRCSPAMEIGVAKTLWDGDKLIEEITPYMKWDVGYLTQGGRID